MRKVRWIRSKSTIGVSVVVDRIKTKENKTKQFKRKLPIRAYTNDLELAKLI